MRSPRWEYRQLSSWAHFIAILSLRYAEQINPQWVMHFLLPAWWSMLFAKPWKTFPIRTIEKASPYSQDQRTYTRLRTHTSPLVLLLLIEHKAQKQSMHYPVCSLWRKRTGLKVTLKVREGSAPKLKWENEICSFSFELNQINICSLHAAWEPTAQVFK